MSSEPSNSPTQPSVQPSTQQPAASQKNYFNEWHAKTMRDSLQNDDGEQEILAASATSAYRDIEAAVAIGRSLLPQDKLTISHTIEIARFIHQITAESMLDTDDVDPASGSTVTR